MTDKPWYPDQAHLENAFQHRAGVGVLDGNIDLTGVVIGTAHAVSNRLWVVQRVMFSWTGNTYLRVKSIQAAVASVASDVKLVLSTVQTIAKNETLEAAQLSAIEASLAAKPAPATATEEEPDPMADLAIDESAAVSNPAQEAPTE